MAFKCPKCQFENPDDIIFCGKCGIKLSSPKEDNVTETLEAPKDVLTTGSTFAGRYQIIEELGKGGMGRVYKVHDTEIKEKVALKLLKPEIASDEKTIERFRSEIRLARKIVHKNVGRMYDLGKSEGSYFITMEYVPGEDLKSFIRRSGKLVVGTAVKLASQVCNGLTEAHKSGVIHRDLKPSNIMIDKEGNARIMDFGIARFLKEKGITGAGFMIGTPEYMSPEQAEAKDVDHRSDIYSLGVILYEMVTGQLPFDGDTPLSIAMKHKGEVPKDPREINSQIQEDLSRLILKCMEKEKENRYQTSEELLKELALIEEGIPTPQKEVAVKKPITSKEITVRIGLKKLLIPAVVVSAVIIIAIIYWRFLMKKEPVSVPATKSSIAVLPFVDFSPQKDQEYLCDGLTDELINRLTNIERLRVPARTSAFLFKGKELDLQEIGEKLNVEMVLEGSLRKSGNKLRITVQLVNISDGFPIWSEKYERDEEDIFVLQDEISLAIVDKLQIQLLGEEGKRLTLRFTEDLEAYNLYLQGRFFLEKRTEEGLRKAIDFFEKAIEKDPGYSLAYVGLADTYSMLDGYGVLSPGDVYPKAKEAVVKALEIDDKLAEAHTSLGFIRFFYDWDWSGAEREFKRAIEINPDLAQAHHWFGWYLAGMGRLEKARAAFERARELDPLSLIINAASIWCFNASRLTDQATEQLQKTLELDPNYPRAHFWFGQTLLQKGELGEAIEEFRKALDISVDSPQYLSMLAHAYALADRRDEALKILNKLYELSKQRYVSPIELAIAFIGLNDKDKAFEWLERAYEERSGWMSVIKVEPRYDMLRSDPRFKTLLEKMELEK